MPIKTTILVKNKIFIFGRSSTIIYLKNAHLLACKLRFFRQIIVEPRRKSENCLDSRYTPKITAIKIRNILITTILGTGILLASCAQNNTASTYGIPPSIWAKMTPDQRQQIASAHQEQANRSYSSGYGSTGFVVENDTN